MISDLLDDEENIMKGLRHFRHKGHEVIIFHIIDPKEKNLDFDENINFIDIENEDNLIVSMSFLLNIADDNEVANQIRNELPFGDVFNYWREELGACGMFQWNDDLYLTLNKEESITDCEVYDQQ